MFLTRLLIDVRSREFRRDFGNVHDMHRTLMKLFPEIPPGTPARHAHNLLWRLDPAHTGYTQYIQSRTAPDLAKLPAGLVLEPPAVRPLQPVLDAIQPGRRLAFRLVANPTRCVRFDGAPEKRKHVGLTTPEKQVDWLVRRGERHGFAIPAGRNGEPDVAPIPVPRLVGRREEATITISPVRFEGTLIVTDADAFTQAVVSGIGRGKSYGCGLISLALPRPR
ncbi:type I-E CRISPR-associated protein Cas6/Cse3/CasE [Actinokineospora sp. NPDC004072]